MVKETHKSYAEFYDIVQDLLCSPDFQRLNLFKHHFGVSRMHHCINVAYYSYILCKKLNLDYRAVARAGLLHDLFYYECTKKRFGAFRHAAIHPKLALRNAEKLTPLSKKEKDIIVQHMWLCSRAVPHYTESYIVSCVDKYSAVYEALYGVVQLCRMKLAFGRM